MPYDLLTNVAALCAGGLLRMFRDSLFSDLKLESFDVSNRREGLPLTNIRATNPCGIAIKPT